MHGQEFRPAPGDFRLQPATPDFEKARRRLSALVLPNDPLLIEDKGGALVLHYRQHPDQRGRAASIAQQIVEGLADLFVVDGHAIYEIRERAINKSMRYQAVRRPAGLPPAVAGLHRRRHDRRGRPARRRLAAGGFGIKVGPGATEAAYRLPDVSAVHQWLTAQV